MAEPVGNRLRRLARDRRGSLLPIMAAALIPMIGMAGGGLDAARLYLAKTRLQQACDAAALAGRRSMTSSTWTDANKTVADQYFNANFTPGRYGTNGAAITYVTGTDQIVHGTATVNVPMVLMQVLGVGTQTLTATCDAQLQVPNSDIMFVLDTTLSMNTINGGDTDSRIGALRKAVKSFYDTMESVRGSGSQVRYGFVPYSSTVNVGALLKRDWVMDNPFYQSRTMFPSSKTNGTSWVRDGDVAYVSGSVTKTITTTSDETCADPPDQGYTDKRQTESTGSDTQRVTRTQNGITYTVSRDSSNNCVITKYNYSNYITRWNEKKVNSTVTTNYVRYEQRQFDEVAGLKGNNPNGLVAGGHFDEPDGGAFRFNFDKVTVSWDNIDRGMCIEERETVRTSSPGVVPTRPDGSEPYDLDVDLVPTPGSTPEALATQWKPFLPQVVFARKVPANTYYANGGKPTAWSIPATGTTTEAYVYLGSPQFKADYAACPSPSRKLMSNPGGLTSSVLQTYLNALQPAGFTYHDIGFLWGLRLMSPNGIFGNENQTAPNGGSIARHLIFMTDGDTQTNRAAYEAYGLSALDVRRTTPSTVSPSDDDQDTIVETRLSHLCSVAKDQKNITVWVIAFGDDATLSPLLTNCASPNRAFKANNATELNATFVKIASQIAQLRLTK